MMMMLINISRTIDSNGSCFLVLFTTTKQSSSCGISYTWLFYWAYLVWYDHNNVIIVDDHNVVDVDVYNVIVVDDDYVVVVDDDDNVDVVDVWLYMIMLM